MSWWDTVVGKLKKGDELHTPGRGLTGGNRKKPFIIDSLDHSCIIVQSGQSMIPLIKECFDVVEDYFKANPLGWLRVASKHDSEPFDNSADKLMRDATQSQLARGNYVCAILVNCGLTMYAMQVNKKVIVLPR